MALLFVDENFPSPTVEGLRRLGHDVVTVAEVALAGLGTPEEDVLAFADADRPRRTDTQSLTIPQPSQRGSASQRPGPLHRRYGRRVPRHPDRRGSIASRSSHWTAYSGHKSSSLMGNAGHSPLR